MNCKLPLALIAANLSTIPPVLAQADHLPVIDINATAPDSAEQTLITSQAQPAQSADSAALLIQAPGADVNRNGALTGISQYRGLYGTRMNVSIDGMSINSGGPNWMDPPLSYAPQALLDALIVHRGIPSVSVAGESLGGYIEADTLSSDFTSSADFSASGRINAGAQSVNNGSTLGAFAAYANHRHRMHLAASHEQADDYEFPGGTVSPTGYQRDQFMAGYGFQQDGQHYSIDIKRNETGDSGTPAIAMDIVYINTNLLNLGYQGQAGGTRLEGRLFYSDVEHLMSNYRLRMPMNAAILRENFATGDGTGYALHASRRLGKNRLSYGVDGHLTGHDSTITDPNNAMFFIDNFRGVTRDRHSGFIQWQAPMNDQWRSELGLRVSRISSDAGTVDSSMAAMPTMMGMNVALLRDAFNNADRSQTDTNIDWVAKAFHQLTPGLELEIGAARKTRSPSYQERYLWLPLQSTAGLADGYSYLGDINLKPEISHQLELGLHWKQGDIDFSPRLFYRKVRDYIQGVPATNTAGIAVATMMQTSLGVASPLPPLQFANVDATLYGLDTGLDWRLDRHWSLQASLSYVRGRRDDVSDNLYRISPLSGSLATRYQTEVWSATAEILFADQQDQVASVNNEPQTPGYGVVNLSGTYRINQNVDLKAGVSNLFDKLYTPHLGGINRVMGSDVALGARLPAPGRSLFVNASLSW